MVSVAEHLLEDEAGFFKPPGPRKRLDEPERTQVERALLPHEAVGGLLHVVAENEAACDQPVVFRGAVDRVKRLEHPGTFGATKNTSGMMRLEASRVSSP